MADWRQNAADMAAASRIPVRTPGRPVAARSRLGDVTNSPDVAGSSRSIPAVKPSPSALRVVDLKQELKRIGAPTAGRKAELVERLRDRRQQAAPADSPLPSPRLPPPSPKAAASEPTSSAESTGDWPFPKPAVSGPTSSVGSPPRTSTAELLAATNPFARSTKISRTPPNGDRVLERLPAPDFTAAMLEGLPKAGSLSSASSASSSPEASPAATEPTPTPSPREVAAEQTPTATPREAATLAAPATPATPGDAEPQAALAAPARLLKVALIALATLAGCAFILAVAAPALLLQAEFELPEQLEPLLASVSAAAQHLRTQDLTFATECAEAIQAVAAAGVQSWDESVVPLAFEWSSTLQAGGAELIQNGREMWTELTTSRVAALEAEVEALQKQLKDCSCCKFL